MRCGNKNGSSFFCFINYPNRSSLLPVLNTNHHMFRENDNWKSNIYFEKMIIKLNNLKLFLNKFIL